MQKNYSFLLSLKPSVACLRIECSISFLFTCLSWFDRYPWWRQDVNLVLQTFNFYQNWRNVQWCDCYIILHKRFAEINTYLMEVLVPQTILVPPNITWDFLNATSRVSPIITRKVVLFSSPFHLMSRQDAINSWMWLILTFSRSIPKS